MPNHDRDLLEDIDAHKIAFVILFFKKHPKLLQNVFLIASSYVVYAIQVKIKNFPNASIVKWY